MNIKLESMDVIINKDSVICYLRGKDRRSYINLKNMLPNNPEIKPFFDPKFGDIFIVLIKVISEKDGGDTEVKVYCFSLQEAKKFVEIILFYKDEYLKEKKYLHKKVKGYGKSKQRFIRKQKINFHCHV